jgi:hypothetical protein
MFKFKPPAIEALAALSFALAPATWAAETSDGAAANQLFQGGKFAEASAIDTRLEARNPSDYRAILQLGRVALLSNDLAAARRWFTLAIGVMPAESDPKVMLAEAYYRADDFQHATAALAGVDVANNQLITSQYPTLNVAKLESFKGQTPYEVVGSSETTVVKFVRSEPLPIVSVRVNGGAPVTFFIDTGGSEVVLDKAFAQELGAPNFGLVKGTFSGGQHAEVGHSRIDSLTLGDWTIRNLPAATLPLRQLSEGLGVKQIDGIIGTTLFYHFLTTLDYPRGQLVLRRKTAENLQKFEAAAGASRAVLPFWMASDHFMVTWGKVESLPPTLLFVDTGLAGAGIKLAEQVIKQAGITLDESKATEGAGGGGTLKTIPYTVRRVALGNLVEENVAGLYDGPFPWEDSFGFHLAGMVGHDVFKPYAETFDFQNMKMFIQ